MLYVTLQFKLVQLIKVHGLAATFKYVRLTCNLTAFVHNVCILY